MEEEKEKKCLRKSLIEEIHDVTLREKKNEFSIGSLRTTHAWI